MAKPHIGANVVLGLSRVCGMFSMYGCYPLNDDGYRFRVLRLDVQKQVVSDRISTFWGSATSKSDNS